MHTYLFLVLPKNTLYTVLRQVLDSTSGETETMQALSLNASPGQWTFVGIMICPFN
jgi:hypothetical protein